MSNNINWVGNKVFNPGANRSASHPTYTMPPEPDFNFSPPISEMGQSEDMTGGPVPFRQGVPPATERGYIPYYLTSNIGKNVRAEFIIGSNQYTDRTGKLIEVGINYFVLEDVNSRTHVMCDLYSVKFVTILQS